MHNMIRMSDFSGVLDSILQKRFFLGASPQTPPSSSAPAYSPDRFAARKLPLLYKNYYETHF